MDRVLEPEIMDGKEQALAYANSNLSASNRLYVDQLLRDFSERLTNVIDIGCGPAYVPIRIARQKPNINITAVDGSSEMIKLAIDAVRSAGVEGQVDVIQGYIPGVELPERSYDAILSKDFLHHLPDPMVLWNEATRLAKPGAAVYVMDLFRPKTHEEAKRIVEDLTGDQSSILQNDFYNSLCAAFTLEEVKEQIRETGLDLKVEQMSERHLLVKGSMISL